jgi:hypothetical protein
MGQLSKRKKCGFPGVRRWEVRKARKEEAARQAETARKEETAR